MDIARYIALFLLKNKYCHIHGLGNLELKKKPAFYDGETLHAGEYIAVLSQTGSIDDALPNFIASNEHVSIAKASNEIKDFTTRAKADLADGKDIVIPSIGKYTSINGRLNFILDPSFSPQQLIPAFVKTATPIEAEQPKPQQSAYAQQSKKGNKVNWGLIILWIAIIAIIIAALIFAVRYFMNQPDEAKVVVPVSDSQTIAPVMVNNIDTTLSVTDTTAVAAEPVTAGDTPVYNIALSSYKTLTAAQKREKQLKSFGHNVLVTTKDSGVFYVILPVKAFPADTISVKDSLSLLFNKNGVSIYN